MQYERLWIGIQDNNGIQNKERRCSCVLRMLSREPGGVLPRVESTYGNNLYGREYKKMIEMLKIHFEVEP